MSGGTLFERLDAGPLQKVTERYSFAFIGAAARISRDVIPDGAISPRVMIAGVCRAHAACIASMITSGADFGADFQEQLLAAVTAFILAELQDLHP